MAYKPGVNIDLVKVGDGELTWCAGNQVTANYTITSINQAVTSLLAQSPSGYIFFYNPELGAIDEQRVIALIERDNQILFGVETEFPELLSYSIPSSYFNLRPSGEAASYTSWLVSLQCCVVDKNLLAELFLDARFNTVQGAVLHWGYTQLFAGALIRFTRKFSVRSDLERTPDRNDQLLFVHFHQGFKWAGWTCFRLLITGYGGVALLIRYLFSIRKEKKVPVRKIDWTGWKKYSYDQEAKVTVLIPTVDRYPYLLPMLEQLKIQTIRPHEIIVIDQTQKKYRKELSNMGDLPLRVFYMDEAGQCRSRNLGLQHATGNYILFLDDDDEVYPSLIEDHLKNMACFEAQVSCGVCQEPGQGEVPWQYKITRISDVFPTNNGMVKREVLMKSGLFDMAYDRGQRADGDLGVRMVLSGALMILNPEISVIHHRAPQGGLRNHNVRKVTYSSSRNTISHFRLPHITELYFNYKYFTELQQREYIWLSLLGTFSIRGSWYAKGAKFVWALLNLPANGYKIRERNEKAIRLIKDRPFIPTLLK